MSALALLTFVSCEDNEGNVDLDNVTEDGFYVAGPATGAAELTADYMMSAGLNEAASNARRDGMYEKYIALEKGKDFELILYKAGEKTRYSAELSDLNTNGEGDQPTVVLKRGALVTGPDAKAMQVAASGLYHIVLDLNNAKDLANPQIIVAPVSWGVRGVNADWGWKEMTASEFNQKTMTWTINYDAIKNGEFKFSYGGGWKIQLDDAGNVKANTNLGEDMVNGAANIKNTGWKPGEIVLTWNLAGGEIKNGYSYEIKGTPFVFDPLEYVVGFSGGCFGADASWTDPAGATLAVVDKASCTVTDDNNKAGTYVYKVTNLAFEAGEFKVRFDGGWYGASQVEITGMNVSGDDNITAEAGTYDAVITVKYNGSAPDGKIKVAFTKK